MARDAMNVSVNWLLTIFPMKEDKDELFECPESLDS
jgi:hypothetical protein